MQPSRNLEQSVIALVQTPTVLDDARSVVQRECLRASGYDVPFTRSTGSDRTFSATGITGLVSSAAEARASGFSSTVKDEVDPITVFEEQLAPRDRARFAIADRGPENAHTVTITLTSGAQAGRSTTGCTAESFAAMYGSVKTSLYLDNFVNEVLAIDDSSDAARLVNRLLPTYTKCMATAGYKVNKLDADELARKKFGKYRKPGEPPKAAEAKMAVTDAECQQKAGLVKETNNLFFTKASKWITEHEAQILGWQEDLDAAKRRAKKIIADA